MPLVFWYVWKFFLQYYVFLWFTICICKVFFFIYVFMCHFKIWICISPLQSHLRTQWSRDPLSSCWWLVLHTTWPVWLVGPSLRHTSSGPRMAFLRRGPTTPRWLIHTHAHMQIIAATRVCVCFFPRGVCKAHIMMILMIMSSLVAVRLCNTNCRTMQSL